ncbi:hypothetical protein ACTFIZ_011229 [Dictyostelium cf. discoideum]
MKFIPALIIFVFTIFALTNSETTYSGFSITSSDSTNPCSISVPQTDVGTKCVDVCGQGKINIAQVSGETNQYTINGFAPTDECTTSIGEQTLTCGTPATVGAFSIDCTPVAAATTADTTTADTTTADTTTADTTTADTTTAETTTADTTTAATTTSATTGAATTGAATTGAATTGAATTGAATTGAATTGAATTTGTSSTIVIPLTLIVSLLLSVITL